jgi:hypothetical protein
MNFHTLNVHTLPSPLSFGLMMQIHVYSPGILDGMYFPYIIEIIPQMGMLWPKMHETVYFHDILSDNFLLNRATPLLIIPWWLPSATRGRQVTKKRFTCRRFFSLILLLLGTRLRVAASALQPLSREVSFQPDSIQGSRLMLSETHPTRRLEPVVLHEHRLTSSEHM